MALIIKALGWIFSLTLASLIWSAVLKTGYLQTLSALFGSNVIGYIIRSKLK